MGVPLKNRSLNRRDFLRLGAISTAGAVLHACSPTGKKVAVQTASPASTASSARTIAPTAAPTSTATPTRTALAQPTNVYYPARVLPDRFIGIYTSWWGGTKQEERDFIDDLVRRAPGLGATVINMNFAWIALQPEQTTCDFTHMQDLITRIKRGGMQCVLRIYGQMGGIQLWPEWLRPQLKDVYNCPGLYAAEVTNPTPWDAGYQKAFADFLLRLGAWFRERADSVPDGYQIALGGEYGDMYLGCDTHYPDHDQEQSNLTSGGIAAVNAHYAALADVIPDLILLGEEEISVVDRAVELGIRWIQRNDGAKEILYPPWNDHIPLLKLFPSNAFILEDESGWSHHQIPLQTRVDYLNQIEAQKEFRFQGVFIHSHDVAEENRGAIANLREYLDQG
jgi:hypothetical protein